MEQLALSLTISLVVASSASGPYASVSKPPWATPLLVIAIAILAIAAVPMFVELDERLRRRIYWGAYLIGTLLMAAAVSFRGWGTSVGTCIVGTATALCFAFFYNVSLIKIGNREICYMSPCEGSSTSAAPPADSHLDVVPARNHWWVVAVGSCVLAYGVYLYGSTWDSLEVIGFAVVAAALSGAEEATHGLPIARGQKVQFAIASVASVVMLGLPLLAHLGAYFGVRRWGASRGGRAGGRAPD